MNPFTAQANPPCRAGDRGNALQLVGEQLPNLIDELNEGLTA